MKTKALIAAFIICMAATTRVYSFGVGGQLNFSAGEVFAPGAALVISPNETTHIAVNWFLGSDDRDDVNTICLTFDKTLITLPISTFSAGTFNFTLGAGLFTNFLLSDHDPGFNGGLRIPIGLNVMLGKNIFEIYTHVAPSFGIRFAPSLGLTKPFFPFALGVRVWFG